jgi:geranylgeranyl diphosphate synthase type II
MASWWLNRSNPKARAESELFSRFQKYHTERNSILAMKLPSFFEEDLQMVDAALQRLLPPADAPPVSIHEAMRYSVFAGGKRIRPILCLETARIFTGEIAPTLHPACAIEFIHTYSLIHDDLPALDNDDLRRGKPTCHKKFGEAIAILAGDALLTLAFETIGAAPVDAELRVAMLTEIATSAGTIDGMVGGQVADLEAEGKQVGGDTLEYIHRAKTAALIRAAITAGAICGGASKDDVARLRHFGETIGWAFQVRDDILDVEESSAALGKTAGKDIAQKKATYPAVFGLKRSHEISNELSSQAIADLAAYGDRAARLREIGEFLVQRRT